MLVKGQWFGQVHITTEGGGGGTREPCNSRGGANGRNDKEKKEKTRNSGDEQQRGAHGLDGLDSGLGRWLVKLSRPNVAQ